MKNLILILLVTFLFCNASIGQQITLNFTVDNIFSAYVGNSNGVTQNKVPPTEKNGGQIFTATSVTTNYTSGDWFYIIAWSDDATCQGMIGEVQFEGTTISTGDDGWEVFPTKQDLDKLSQAPSVTQINQQITIANNSSGWKELYVGPTNAKAKSVCRNYPRPVSGISGDANWVWYNSNNAASPFSPGHNHGEYLIFRYPMNSIGGGDCCDEINELKKDIRLLKKQIRSLQSPRRPRR